MPTWFPRTRPALMATTFVTLVVANTLLRDFRWRYEWNWAAFNAGFVTVLLCPLAAGAASLGAIRFVRTRREAAVAAGRLRRAVVVDVWAVLRWVWAAHVAGLLLVGAVVAVSSRHVPPASVVRALPGPFLQLAASVTIGWMAGAVIRRWWGAAIIASAWFVGTIILYLQGTEVVVRTGGATSSLVGLQLSTSYVVRQCSWLALVALVGTAVGVVVSSAERIRFGAVAVGLALIATSGTAAGWGRPQPFRYTQVELRCDGGRPPICLEPEYWPLQPEARRQLDRALAWWKAIDGTPVPTKVIQTERSPAGASINVGSDLITAPDFAGQLINLLLRDAECGDSRDRRLDDPFSLLMDIAYAQLEGKVWTQQVSDASPAELHRLAVDAVAEIRSVCSTLHDGG